MAPAGSYRERVAFDQREDLSDSSPAVDYGNTQGDWQEQFVVAARIEPLRGAESVQASRLAGKQPVKITVRVSSDTRLITTDWRARDVRSGTIYNIRSKVNPDERKVDFDLECEAGVAV